MEMEIRALKTQNAIIMAHNYQPLEIRRSPMWWAIALSLR